MVARNEIVHVAVAPPATLDEELVKKVSAIVGKSPYETRLRLTGKIPKIIANYDILSRAESAAVNLRALGLIIIVASDSELRKPPQIFKAQNLKLEEGAITFSDRSSQSKRMEVTQVFLILKGRMQIYTETEETKTKRKLNVTATLLMGGIPITKKVKEKSKNTSYQTENFIRLYDRRSPEVTVQISQPDFDYSFLGPEMVSSAAANYAIAVRKIREAFPQAIFDDELIEAFGANIQGTMVRDTIEANCKLIFLYHRAVSDISTSLQLQM